MDKLKAVLFFDSMITPKVITFIYWIVLALILVVGIISGLIALTQSVLSGILTILLIPLICLLYRMLFEMIIIAFKNNEYLKKIAEKE